MSDDRDATADVALKVAGQEVNVRNIKSVNTIATVLTLIVVCTGGVLIWKEINMHTTQAREDSKEFVAALREQTVVMKDQVQAQRESNCLQSYLGPADSKANFCRGIAR